jgi:hypothetical protein
MLKLIKCAEGFAGLAPRSGNINVCACLPMRGRLRLRQAGLQERGGEANVLLYADISLWKWTK